MKKITLLALTALMMAGCVYKAKAYHDKQIDLVGDYGIVTIEYQGCEYVVMQSHWKQQGTMIHKGNCKFCKERRQKELEELVIKLKEK